MLVFGPIPSRRLGRSLGINNIPPKVCSYSCVYCQVGSTDTMSIQRREFFSTEEIYNEVKSRVSQLNDAGEIINFLSFVPDGEPTLDVNLGKTIEKLKIFDIKIAVISNSSLMWDENARNDLMKADWVSLKTDSLFNNEWHKINRPHKRLELAGIVDGIEKFASDFKGTLCTETMLVRNINDGMESINKTAQFISNLNPSKAYILTPVRPPAENWVKTSSEYNLGIAYRIFNSYGINAEFLTSDSAEDFTYSSDVENELLSILAVHPMKKKAIEEFLVKANSDWDLIEYLIEKTEIKEIKHSGTSYYVKNEKQESTK